jgi:integrase/recombinase XerD
MSVTTAIILDQRRMNKETKNYPVAIRVTFERKPRVFPIGMELSKKDFSKLFSQKSAPHLGEKLREIKEKLENEDQRARNIIKNINKFSFDAFYQEFSAFRHGARPKPMRVAPSRLISNHHLPNPAVTDEYMRTFYGNQFGGRKYPRRKSEIDFPALGEVAFYYGRYITKLEARESVGTVTMYMCSLTSLLSYKPQLRFLDMTDLELLRYEKWMKSQGRSVTTISIYLRCFRKVYRTAIAKKVVSQDDYPFGSEGYTIPTALNVKKARPISDIQQLYEYRPASKALMMARDFWIFSYLGNGMNPKDIAMLTYGMIDGDFLRFYRAKTILTTRANPQQISVFLSEEVKAIIERQGNKDRSPANYIFPVVTPEMDAYEQDRQIEQFRHLVNGRLELICKKDLNLENVVKFEDARHSAATQLKRSKTDLEFIREFMGHKDIKTTMNYLDSFVDETKAEEAKKLLPFINEPTMTQKFA